MKISPFFVALTVAASLFLGTTANAADTISPAQKTQIETIIHDYMLKNPEVIIQSIQAMQQKAADAMRSHGAEAGLKNANALVASALDPVEGNPQGKVSVIEFFDYQCPHCVDMMPVFKALVKDNPDVRVVYKDFPIRGPLSSYAAKAALAANKQGKYIEFHDALMKAAPNKLTEAKIDDIAKTLGLDLKKFKSDMNSDAVTAQIKGNYKLAQDIGIMGTPAIFVFKTTLPKDADATAINFIPGQVDEKFLLDAVTQASK
jgi:protein-disulfide isomerase